MRVKSLKNEVSVSELLHMREQGMTNKQIASSLDVSVNTVYRYIGRKSEAVKRAAVQGKPCPVPNPLHLEEEKPAIERAMKEEKKVEKPAQKVVEGPQIRSSEQYETNLPVLKERRIVELQGDYCVYEVDTGDKSVIMKNGEESALVTGMLDKESLGLFIRELMQIHRLLG